MCDRTHAARVKRHNMVVELVVRNAKRKGWNCKVEPAIPSPEEIRRPDLIIYQTGKPCYVIDATIICDNVDLSLSHNRKCQYYNKPEIFSWVKRATGSDKVEFSSASLSWRDLFVAESAQCLCNTVGLNAPTLSL